MNNPILTEKVFSEGLIGVDNCPPLMINDIYSTINLLGN